MNDTMTIEIIRRIKLTNLTLNYQLPTTKSKLKPHPTSHAWFGRHKSKNSESAVQNETEDTIVHPHALPIKNIAYIHD